MYDNGIPVFGPEVEMVEADDVRGWLEFFFSMILSAACMFIAILLTLYFTQEGMLYIPGQPI